MWNLALPGTLLGNSVAIKFPFPTERKEKAGGNIPSRSDDGQHQAARDSQLLCAHQQDGHCCLQLQTATMEVPGLSAIPVLSQKQR